MFTKYVSRLRSFVLIIPKAACLFFFWGIPPKISTSIYSMELKLAPGIALEKRCWLMTSLSKSSNPCVSQVNQKPFLLTSAEIEILLRQSTSFSGLTCKDSRLSLDHKIWHGSYSFLEILVCKFWQDWKMDHLPVLRSLMRSHFNLKMFQPKFCPLGKSFITIPKVVLGLQKKVVQRGISRVES